MSEVKIKTNSENRTFQCNSSQTGQIVRKISGDESFRDLQVHFGSSSGFYVAGAHGLL